MRSERHDQALMDQMCCRSVRPVTSSERVRAAHTVVLMAYENHGPEGTYGLLEILGLTEDLR